MNNTIRLLLAALGLGFFACDAPAQEYVPPFKVKFHFGCDVQCLNRPQPCAPWWAYFPQDAHHAPATGSIYPNWPAQFPPGGQAASPRTSPLMSPNITRGYAPTPVQPVGWRPAPYPSYWYPQ